jgi:hypothetical protein
MYDKVVSMKGPTSLHKFWEISGVFADVTSEIVNIGSDQEAIEYPWPVDRNRSYIESILHYYIHTYRRSIYELGDSLPALSGILRARDDQDVLLVDAIVVSIAARSTAAGGTLMAKIRGVITSVAIASVSVTEVSIDGI